MISLSKITFSYGVCIKIQTIGLWYFMRWGNVHKSIPVWVMKWCEGFIIHLARPFNIKSSHYISYSMWQQVFWTSTRKAPWTHINNIKEFCTISNTKEFSTYNVNPTFSNFAKGQPHANWLDNIQTLHIVRKGTPR